MKAKFTFLALTIIVNIYGIAQNLNTTLIGHWGYGPCYTVSESGNYAFIGSGCMLLVIDKTNPGVPVKVGDLLLPDVIQAIAVDGDHVYIANDEAGLRITNISNPTEPFEEGYYDTPGNAMGVDVSGNYAYVADGECRTANY